MTAWPEGVRIAIAGDEARVFDLCVMAHAENGFGRMDELIVREFIRQATHRENCIIAIIDGPEHIEAMLGLRPLKLWYSLNEPDSYYWSDLFFFVHPLHRQSRHAAKLFRFAQWWEGEIHAPVILELLPREDFEQKDKLFARFGKRIGGAYAIGDLGKMAVSGNARH